MEFREKKKKVGGKKSSVTMKTEKARKTKDAKKGSKIEREKSMEREQGWGNGEYLQGVFPSPKVFVEFRRSQSGEIGF